MELRTFIPGRIMQDVPYTTDLLVKDGEFVAEMANALEVHAWYYFTQIILNYLPHLWLIIDPTLESVVGTTLLSGGRNVS